MTQIDQIIADALAGMPETDVAILAREVVRLRRCTNGIDASDLEIVAQWGNKYDPPQHYFQALSRVQDTLRANQGGADHG